MIPTGAAGAWNQRIYEIGNVLYEPTDSGKEYKTWYTATNNQNDDGYTNLVVGYAYSSDGISWTQQPCVLNNMPASRTLEDPYILKVNSVYYLYAELKSPGGIQESIIRMHSSNGLTWIYDQVVLEEQGSGWERTYVASPIVWRVGSTWHMLYEGAVDYDSGKTGKCESTDGLNWTNRRMVYDKGPSGAWDDMAIVCDDVYFEGDICYFSYHGTDGSTWKNGYAYTTDFVSWVRYSGNPISTETSVMFAFFNGARNFYAYDYLNDGRGIYLYETTPVTSGPTYSSISVSSSVAGSNAVFSCLWRDNSALGRYIFSTNNSGTWVNNTAVNFNSNPSWANATKTLNSAIGTVVAYRWFASNSDGLWTATPIQTLKTSGHGVVSIAFDDNYADQYQNAYPLMQSRGLKATYYVVTNQIREYSQDPGYMNIANLQTLQASGNEIGSHSVTHSEFIALSDADIRSECTVSKQILQSNGLSVSNFAYPDGVTNDHVDSIVSEYYRSGRTAYVEPYLMGLGGQFRLAGFSSEGYPNELQSLKDMVDQAYATNSWVIIFFHHIVPGDTTSPYTTSSQDFASFLDYTIGKGVEISTVNQTLNKGSSAPSILFSDGFESGNLNAWTQAITYDSGCTFTASTAKPYSGVYSGRAVVDGGAVYDHALVEKNLGAFTSISTQAHFCLSVLPPPGSSTTLIGYTNGYDDHEGVILKNTAGTYYLGVVRYISGSSNRQVVFVPISLATNTWFEVKFTLVASSTAGLERVYFNGVEQAGLTRLNADNDRGGAIDTCIHIGTNGWDNYENLGQGGANWAFTMYVDDVVATSYTNSVPTYSNAAHSSYIAGSNAVFSSLWNDDSGLSKYIFSTNNTGTWVNSTATAFSSTPGWANITKSLNSNVGTVVAYRWFANDSDNAWSSTGIYTVTTTSLPSASITPTEVVMNLGASQNFTAAASGGLAPYRYQWYLNGTAVEGAASKSWIFTPQFGGNFTVYADVTDSGGLRVKSNTVKGMVTCKLALSSQQNTALTSNLGAIKLQDITYTLPDLITLQANAYSVEYLPVAGYSFDHWQTTGAITLTNPNAETTTLTVNGNGTLNAVYKAIQYSLTININPTQAGTVLANNTGPYHYGDVVLLTPTANLATHSIVGLETEPTEQQTLE